MSPHQFYIQSHTSLPTYNNSIPSQTTTQHKTNSPTFSTTDLPSGSCLPLLECNTWHMARLVRSLSSSVLILRLRDTCKIAGWWWPPRRSSGLSSRSLASCPVRLVARLLRVLKQTNRQQTFSSNFVICLRRED